MSYMFVNETVGPQYMFDLSGPYKQATEFITPYVLPYLSPYMPMLQSINPQPVFQSYWEQMTQQYSEYQIATWGSLIVQVSFYFGTCLPFFLFQFLSFTKFFKIQKRNYNLGDQWTCLQRVLVSKTLIYAPLITMLFLVVHKFNINVPQDYASMPNWYVMPLKMLFCLICEDTWHYWAHRLLHIPSLYWIHKLHHKYTAPFGMAAEFAHPIETLALGVGFFIPMLFVCDHIFVFWCWLATRMLQTSDVHSGYDFPWLNPMYLLPFYGGVRFHDFHHYYFQANYASTFTFWDWLCGTDKPFKEFEKKRIAVEKQGKRIEDVLTEKDKPVEPDAELMKKKANKKSN